jgi:hypothetical protein
MLYTLLDTNDNGMLDLAELPSAVRRVLRVPVVEVDAMIEFLLQELGKDGSSSIDVAELVRLIEDIGGLYEPAGVDAAHRVRWSGARVWRPGCGDGGVVSEGWKTAWQRWVAQLPVVARQQYGTTRASYAETAEEVAAVCAAAQQEEEEYPHTAVWRWLHGEAYREPEVDFCPIDKAPYSWTWMVMPLALCSSLETDVVLGAILIATHPRWGQG